MADETIPPLESIPEAPEAPSRVEYGQNKAEFRPKANLFMDWMVTFSNWLNPFVTSIRQIWEDAKGFRDESESIKEDVSELRNEVEVMKSEVSEDKDMVEAMKSEVSEDKDIVEADRIAVENYLDYAGGILPNGSIDDSTVSLNITWSSEKIFDSTKRDDFFPELKLFTGKTK